MENAYLIDLHWTEEDHAQLKTLVEGYTSWGTSGEWRVDKGRLACISLVLEDMKDHNDV